MDNDAERSFPLDRWPNLKRWRDRVLATRSAEVHMTMAEAAALRNEMAEAEDALRRENARRATDGMPPIVFPGISPPRLVVVDRPAARGHRGGVRG